jgi:creatinine amidohydrolase/Fe(II)-dependent formamide hydrolase-like protein
VDWVGSVSIEAENFKNFVADIIKSFARHGVKKFLILDGGVSTHFPMRILSYDMRNELGEYVAVTSIRDLGKEVQLEVCEQEEGGHADESETSCMLAIRAGQTESGIKRIQLQDSACIQRKRHFESRGQREK